MGQELEAVRVKIVLLNQENEEVAISEQGVPGGGRKEGGK